MTLSIPDNITVEWIQSLSVNELVELLMIAKDAYYNGAFPIMSDDMFDNIENMLMVLDSGNEYFLAIGSEIQGEKVPLPRVLGSLDRLTEGEETRWIKTNKLQDADIVIADKLDGMSILLVYDYKGNLKIAYTRGDGINGQDITRHVRRMKNVPQKISDPRMIRGEIIMREDDFHLVNKTYLNDRYKNSRNYISGQINSIEADQIFYDTVYVVAYEVL